MSLSNFQILRLYKSRYAKFTKSVFQSSQEFVQMKWGQEWECMQPSSSEREEIFDLVFLRKKVLIS